MLPASTLEAMGFSTPSYDLIDLFARIDRGDLQVPDFQREYSWDVDRIRALLVTVLRGYPMGSIMALDTRNEAMRFRPRPLKDAPDLGVNPGLLLLDGQQRLTTLYHCLRGDGIVDTVDFRGKKIRRRFFVDVNAAVSEDIMPDEAIFAVDEDGAVRSHFGPQIPGGLSNRAAALSAGVIPVSSLLSDEGTDMLFDLADGAEPGARERAKQFHNTVAKPLIRYAVPMIRLDRGTARGGVGYIFAQANKAGMPMGIFDLLTAVFSTEDPNFSLWSDWQKTESVLREFPVLDGIKQTQWLTAVALYVSAKKGHPSAQREAILRLTLDEYTAATPIVQQGFIEAADFLKQRCIMHKKNVPYTFQIVPLAVILALFAEQPEVLANARAWDRLDRWFWNGIFGELYGSSSLNNRAARDVAQVTEWISDALSSYPHETTGTEVPEPATVRDSRFTQSRLISGDTKSGVYKGIYALLMSQGARDWRTGKAFDHYSFDQLDTHFPPIFPLSWCADNGIDQTLAHSAINRSPMGRRTEVVLAGASPARYLGRVQSKSLMEDEEFDQVLATHALDPKLLHEANAKAFFGDRCRRLLEMVEQAMGKKATWDISEPPAAAKQSGGQHRAQHSEQEGSEPGQEEQDSDQEGLHADN